MVKCQLCGEEFYLPKARLETAEHYFCSQAHANAWQGRTKTAVTCKVCKVVFKTSPSVPRIYCSLACRDSDPEWLKHILEARVKQFTSTPSGLEVVGYALLDTIPYFYEAQVLLFDKFCVDAVVDNRLVVQFDGDYWHGNPVRFPELDARQRHRASLDRSQDAYLIQCNYRVLRVWEGDMHKRPAWVREQLLNVLVETCDLPRPKVLGVPRTIEEMHAEAMRRLEIVHAKEREQQEDEEIFAFAMGGDS